MRIITSWDDGHPLDLKLADMLEKYNIPAIFYIPIKNQETALSVMSSKEICSLSKRFKIGGHTYNHVKLTEVSFEIANKEIVDGKKALEDIVQNEIKSFSYPCGYYNDNVVELVKTAGFEYSRSARLINFNNPQISDFINHPNLHFYPHKAIIDVLHCIKQKDLYTLKNRICVLNCRHIELYKKESFYKGGIFHLWGHSWEIEKYNLWNKLEDIFDFFNSISIKNGK